MKCPNCQCEVDDTTLAKYLAAKGGRLSRRSLSPADKLKMQAARLKRAYLTPDQLLQFFQPTEIAQMHKSKVDGREVVPFMEIHKSCLSKFPVIDEKTYLHIKGQVFPKLYKLAKSNRQLEAAAT